jgi:hypothetical protein
VDFKYDSSWVGDVQVLFMGCIIVCGGVIEIYQEGLGGVFSLY